jgi:cellulose synthase/poly-beta-1,6-N-acetylglucosamine synthase-like glycosyltransferase
MALTIICLLLTLVYVLLMVAYGLGWQRQKEFVLPPRYEPVTFITVIIPARNESRNIGACLESLMSQQYPADLLEIIVVDDHSDDDTAAIVSEYGDRNVRCISLADYMDSNAITVAYKKAAIAAGIANSNGTLIVTTDADCMAPNSWLLHMAAIYELESPVMVVAPVIFTSNYDTVQVFQLIDFMSMQGITAAAHNLKLGNMSNGANLAFSKAAYEKVGGYEGIQHLASGDDLLLMMKMNRASLGSISYLKSQRAIVRTAPQPDWGSFLQQRIRWASKSGKYNDPKLTAVLLLVYLFNVSFLVLVIAGLLNPALFYVVGGMLAVKILAEYLFLRPVANFFGERWVLRYFFFLQPLHILYIILAGFLGFIGGYKWKGRSVR